MGREKNPRGRRKKRKKARAGRLGSGLKHHLGAGVTGAELPAMSPPRLLRAQELGASDAGADTCKLGTSNDGAEALATMAPRRVISAPATMAPS